jgi:hypothetical protein
MGQVDIQKFNSENIAELQARVTELEMLYNNLHNFMKTQIQINEFFRRIVDDKFTKEELKAIYERDLAKKEAKKAEENDDSLHKSEENLEKVDGEIEAPDEKMP